MRRKIVEFMMLFFLMLIFLGTTEFAEGSQASLPSNTNQGTGWYLVNYELVDGTGTYGADKSSFTGNKNDMTMTHNRYDTKGTLVAGSTHKTRWVDPPSFLRTGETVSIQYETIQLNSKVWKMGSLAQQSINMNQGAGVGFVASDGTRYITKDFNGILTSQKAVEKGTKDGKRVIQLILGRNYKANYTYKWREATTTSVPATSPVTAQGLGPGWYFKSYTFHDGTGTYGSDKSSFKGSKNNVTMTHNRYDAKGKLIAGSTHQTLWADPSSFLKVGETVSINYETRQISSKDWTMGSLVQQSMNMNQGSGVGFVTPYGAKYITNDFNGTLTAQKPIERGKKGATRVIQIIIGRNYKVSYSYEWKD